ncbi:MAG: hypothetical protein WCA32_24695, partial [Chromatiaceae bacterium]
APVVGMARAWDTALDQDSGRPTEAAAMIAPAAPLPTRSRPPPIPASLIQEAVAKSPRPRERVRGRF